MKLRTQDEFIKAIEDAARDGLTVLANVHAALYGKDGKLKQVEEVHNLITTAGKNHIADRLSSAPGEAAMSHMAVGTGVGAAVVGDTTLGTELDRNALTSWTDAAAVVTYVGTWNAGDATGAITEAGVFNAGAAGTLLMRSVFSVINKAAADTLVITWTLTIA